VVQIKLSDSVWEDINVSYRNTWLADFSPYFIVFGVPQFISQLSCSMVFVQQLRIKSSHHFCMGLVHGRNIWPVKEKLR